MVSTLLTTWLPALVTIVTAFILLTRWINKVDRNTEATEKLTEVFESFSEHVSAKIADLEVRMRVIEARMHRRL